MFKATPSAAAVSRVGPDGTTIWTTGPTENPRFDYPVALVADGLGHVFVVDRGNGRIVVLDAGSGRVAFTFGSPGSDVGQFYLARCIALSGDRVYVSDQQNHRVCIFSYSGQPLGSIGTFGLDPGQLNGPRGVAVDAAGVLYVANNGSADIKVFGPDGSFVHSIGSSLVVDPRGLAFDAGRLYVADGLGRRVVVLSPQGELLNSLAVKFPDGRAAAPFDVSIGGNTIYVHGALA